MQAGMSLHLSFMLAEPIFDRVPDFAAGSIVFGTALRKRLGAAALADAVVAGGFASAPAASHTRLAPVLARAPTSDGALATQCLEEVPFLCCCSDALVKSLQVCWHMVLRPCMQAAHTCLRL